MTKQQQADDRVIWRADLCEKLQVGSEAVRRFIRDGKLPAPDVALSQKTMGWKVSTLTAHGLRIF